MSSGQTERRIRVRNPVGRARVAQEAPLAQTTPHVPREKPTVVRDVVVGIIGGEPTHSTSPALRKPVTEREWDRLGALARDRSDFCLLNVRWPVAENGLVLTAARPVLRDVFRLYGDRTREHPEFNDLREWLGQVRELPTGDPRLITWAPNLAVWYAPGRVIQAFRPLLRDAVRDGLREAVADRLRLAQQRPGPSYSRGLPSPQRGASVVCHDDPSARITHHAWSLQRAAVSWRDEVLALAVLTSFCGMGSDESKDLLREMSRDADPRVVIGDYEWHCDALCRGRWPVDGHGAQHE